MSGAGAHERCPAAVEVSKLGFVGFSSSDLDRFVAHYTEALDLVVVERSEGAVYLTTGSEHHCIVVEAGETRARTRIGFEIHGALDDTARALAGAGIHAESRGDPEPGIAKALVIEEPGGTPLHLYESQEKSGEAGVLGIRPSKLGHVASFVPAIDPIQRFYETVLGFRWSDTIEDYFVFLRCGPDHHTVNFIADREARGMHHIAYEVRDIVHLRDVLDHLSKQGCTLEWGLGRHGVGHNLFSYYRDPDGNLVELFTELDLIFDETNPQFEPRPHHEEHPQGPRVWRGGQAAENIWGPRAPS